MATYDTTFEIEAPVAQVWSALTDFSRYGEWNSAVPSLTGVPREGSALEIALVLGEGTKPMKTSAKIVGFEPERCFAWRGHLGAELLFKGFREFTLNPLAPERTEVRHVEALTGLIAPVFHAVKRKGVVAHHHGFNACLKQRAEDLARA